MSFKEHVYDEMFNNCQVNAEGCWVWKGEVDDYGYPVFGTRRFKEKHMMRQDVKMFEHATGQKVGEDDILVHTCGIRRCLNPSHMKVLTTPEDKAEHDREMVALAKRMLANGWVIDDVAKEVGMSKVRLRFLSAELKVRAVR